MAKRKAGKARKSNKKRQPVRKATAKKPAKRSVKRPKVQKAKKTKKAKRTSVPKAAKAAAVKVPRLERARRTLEETVQTPPSSLDMDRHGSAARSGRAALADNAREHHGMQDVTAGDVDVDAEDAFFTGEEAPGGDNPTPDQDIVDDIGKALGVQYDDNEELKGANKLEERDKHRWELDPASSEDYKDRD
jgi:uncharacterized protein DUF6335